MFYYDDPAPMSPENRYWFEQEAERKREERRERRRKALPWVLLGVVVVSLGAYLGTVLAG
jgi:hypothetical protein